MPATPNLVSTNGLRRQLCPHYTSEAASTAITGATETATNFDTNYTIPAGYLQAGDVIRVTAQGIHTATTGAETHTIALVIGSTTVYVTGNVDPANSDGFWIDAWIQIRTEGGSGTFVASGSVATGASGSASATRWFKASTAIDTSASQVLAIQIDRQGSATDSDSARLDMFIVEIKKAA